MCKYIIISNTYIIRIKVVNINHVIRVVEIEWRPSLEMQGCNVIMKEVQLIHGIINMQRTCEASTVSIKGCVKLTLNNIMLIRMHGCF